MLTAISSFFTGPFFAEYFKDMFLGLLVIAYCAVMLCTRPPRAIPVRDLPDLQPESPADRPGSAARQSNKPNASRSTPKGMHAQSR